MLALKKMEIDQRGESWVIPCREWAAEHLDRTIKYQYRSKSNALRAVRDPKRNLVTHLCHDNMMLYERVVASEIVLFNIHKTLRQFPFDEHVGTDNIYTGSASGVGGSSSGSDTVTGRFAGTATAGSESSDESNAGSDEGDSVSVETVLVS